MSSKSGESVTGAQRTGLRLGLSGKLLLLTIVFVTVAEILIYVPLIGNYRLTWLSDKLAAARTAALVLYAAPNRMIPEDLKRRLLESVGAKTVALKMENMRLLLAFSDMPPEVDHQVDMRDVSMMNTIVDGIRTMFSRDKDVLLVVGSAPLGGEFVEIIIDERPLREAMWKYSKTILFVSLAISAISAMLVYLSLVWLFVRPMRRLTAHMVAFGADPENPARIVVPSGRADEIGIAERELAVMQKELAQTLQQKNRLAALGLAGSKINHDLRNLLASAQLTSARLLHLPAPRVQRFAPKLMRALERAIDFCQSTLSYGRAQEPPPDRKMIGLAALVEEVRETLDLEADARIGWISAVERGLMVDADHDQLLRVLINLTRNAVQALETREPNDPARDQIRITGRREGAVVVIEVSDTGPGFPAKAREHLFEAFQGSTRTGGTGLGLAIASELVRAHGGEIRLAEGTIGAAFHIIIPDRAVELSAHRGARAHG